MTLAIPFAQNDPIETSRLVLRPFATDDRSALAALQSAPGVADYLLWEVPDDAELDRRLEHKINATQLHADDDQLCFAIDWRGEPGLIGEASIVVTDTANATLEVGYVIHPSYQGRGVAKEVTRTLAALAFGALGAHRLIGRIDARNHASNAVLKSLGMRQEAHFVHNEFLKGEWTDEIVLAILETEWPNE